MGFFLSVNIFMTKMKRVCIVLQIRAPSVSWQSIDTKGDKAVPGDPGLFHGQESVMQMDSSLEWMLFFGA